MRHTLLGICLALTLTTGCTNMQPLLTQAPVEPTIAIRPAPPIALPGAGEAAAPGQVDCNSPAHWDGRTLFVFTSVGHPWRTAGPDIEHLQGRPEKCEYDHTAPGGRWIEATWKDPGGKLYGWYHLEPHPVCDSPTLTAPQIGAAVSTDNGLHWHDIGIILTAPPDAMNCTTANRYFSGGNGDFSVILDQKCGDYFYFLISTYNRDVAEQGVAVARMPFADRDAPVGKVVKWRDGQWSQPGLGGHVTPIFRVTTDWHRPDVDAFWGPSVHWNTHVGQYVMLLNRARDKEWAQEGIYLSNNADISNPAGWNAPCKILEASELEGSKWYPQVVGQDRGESDTLAGGSARLFVAGKSKWRIFFLRPGETGPTRPRAYRGVS